MSVYRAVQKSFTLDGAGTFTGDIVLPGGAARLVSHYLKYTATAVGTSVALSDSLSGKPLGAAVVGNTNIDTAVDKVTGGVVHVVITAGTAAGVVVITLYIDVA